MIPDATILLISSQLHSIMLFFLSRNIRTARDRAWAQTVESRGKGPEFWQPYVEEYAIPPKLKPQGSIGERVGLALGRGVALFIMKKVLFLWLNLYPIVGIVWVSWIKALGTAKYLHKQVRRPAIHFYRLYNPSSISLQRKCPRCKSLCS